MHNISIVQQLQYKRMLLSITIQLGYSTPNSIYGLLRPIILCERPQSLVLTPMSLLSSHLNKYIITFLVNYEGLSYHDLLITV